MKMFSANKLTKLGLVTAVAGTMLAAPLMASAEVTADIGVANMYLWRGLDLSNPDGASPSGAEVSGDLYYTHESGVYTGIWMSSEGLANSHETDLNLGYSKSFGDFGVDVGVYEYLYTEAGDPTKSDWQDTDAAEYYLGGSYGPVSLKIYQNTAIPDDRYLTLDGSWGMFGAHIGVTKRADSQEEYNDYNISVSPVDNFTALISMASGNLIDNGTAGTKDPLFVVSYTWPFTVK